MLQSTSYLLLSLEDGSEEVHIGGFDAWEECRAVLEEEVVELLLTLDLLLHLVNVHLLVLLVNLHWFNVMIGLRILSLILMERVPGFPSSMNLIIPSMDFLPARSDFS